jgi:hypothetical protein
MDFKVHSQALLSRLSRPFSQRHFVVLAVNALPAEVGSGYFEVLACKRAEYQRDERRDSVRQALVRQDGHGGANVS